MIKFWLFFLIATSSTFTSCRKQESISKKTHIYYSLNGATCNGEFEFGDDENPLTLDASAVIYPEENENPETIILTFNDYQTDRAAAFILPAKQGSPIVLTHNATFGMSISDGINDWILTSGVENTLLGVSIDITKLERGNSAFGFAFIKQLEANFEGIMTYRNSMNDIEMHTVKGDFFYNGTF